MQMSYLVRHEVYYPGNCIVIWYVPLLIGFKYFLTD